MDSLEARFPILAHEAAGVDCCGCIVVKVHGKDAELTCNECGAVVGVIQVDILWGAVSPDYRRTLVPLLRQNRRDIRERPRWTEPQRRPETPPDGFWNWTMPRLPAVTGI